MLRRNGSTNNEEGQVPRRDSMIIDGIRLTLGKWNPKEGKDDPRANRKTGANRKL